VRIHDRALLPIRPQTPAPAQPAELVGDDVECRTTVVESGATDGARTSSSAPQTDSAFLCERCGTAMYRMHAVWRCPSCRFKTDCCGW
jgi:rubrerythrin